MKTVYIRFNIINLNNLPSNRKNTKNGNSLISLKSIEFSKKELIIIKISKERIHKIMLDEMPCETDNLVNVKMLVSP